MIYCGSPIYEAPATVDCYHAVAVGRLRRHLANRTKMLGIAEMVIGQNTSLLKHFRPRQLGRRIRSPKLVYLLGRSQRPLSAHYGTERGTPIDRYYIDQFVSRHAEDLRGVALEVGAARYLTRFGGPDITAFEVLDINPDNQSATVIGDLRRLDAVPDHSYDCVLLIQVLSFIDDVVAAVNEAARILRPGGTLLVTVPGMAPLDPQAPTGLESWRFTVNSLRFLFRAHFDDANVEISSKGNIRAGLGIWVGMAQEDFRARELNHIDERYPCLLTVRAVKPG